MTCTRTGRSSLVGAFLALAVLAPPAHAVLRSPQVPVSGTALASFFASQGQSLAVVGDQLDMQSFSLSPSTTVTQRATSLGGAGSFGGYNTSLLAPPLYLLFPGAASPGWIAVMSFRTAPVRAVVNLFDASGAFQGSTTYLGADPTAFGFYAQGPAGVVYSQDARNPGGLARILAYAGTGTRTGDTWFACELSTTPEDDFADFVMLLNFSTPPVEAKHTTWARLRRLFR